MSAKSQDEKSAPSCFVSEAEAEARAEAAVAKAKTTITVWSAIFRVSQITVLLLVPWGIWVTQQLFALEKSVAISAHITQQIAINTERLNKVEVALADVNSWRALGPRFTPTDGDNLRLRILNEVGKHVSELMADISGKLAVIQRDNLETQLIVKAHLATHTPAAK